MNRFLPENGVRRFEMTIGNQTSTRFKDEIRIISRGPSSLAALVLLSIVVLIVVVVGQGSQCASACGSVPAGSRRGNGARLLRRADWLHKPGRGTPQHEPPALDADCHLCPQRAGDRPLFRFAQAAHRQLSAMQCRGRAGLQLLSPLPQPLCSPFAHTASAA